LNLAFDHPCQTSEEPGLCWDSTREWKTVLRAVAVLYWPSRTQGIKGQREKIIQGQSSPLAGKDMLNVV
jgi:hypothetical protein